MSENLLVRINLDVLYPPFAQKLKDLTAELNAKGVNYWAISGERTVNEQNSLYALGRTIKNPDGYDAVKKPLGNVVTKAKGGQSFHNFAIAADFCYDKDINRAGLQPDYNIAKYSDLAKAATDIGLESGFYWKFQDAPHLQLPLSKHKIKLDDLLKIYNKNGKAAVFKFLDNYSW